MVTRDEKIIILLIVICWLIGLSVGFLWGTKDTVNKFNDADKVHFVMAQKDYKYCPYCGEHLGSED